MAQVTLKYGVPIAFGVLTVVTIEQVIERAGTRGRQQGRWAAARRSRWSTCCARSERRRMSRQRSRSRSLAIRRCTSGR